MSREKKKRQRKGHALLLRLKLIEELVHSFDCCREHNQNLINRLQHCHIHFVFLLIFGTIKFNQIERLLSP